MTIRRGSLWQFLLGHKQVAGTRKKRRTDERASRAVASGKMLLLLLLLLGSISRQCSSCHDSHRIRCHAQQRKGTVKWLLFLFCPLKIIHQVSSLGERRRRRRRLRVQSSHPVAEPQGATPVSISLDFAMADSGSNEVSPREPSDVLVKEWGKGGSKSLPPPQFWPLGASLQSCCLGKIGEESVVSSAWEKRWDK